MRVVGSVTINLSRMDNYQRQIDEVRTKVFTKWIIRYRTFIQRRWNQYSRGGGDWPPLKPATVLARRPAAPRKIKDVRIVHARKATTSTAIGNSRLKITYKKRAKKKLRTASILRDTNSMFTAMAPALQAPAGSVNEFLTDGSGIEIGFGGSDSHPGGPTFAQIAYWHQTGAGNLPVREIIVHPDSATLSSMLKDMERALNGKPNSI